MSGGPLVQRRILIGSRDEDFLFSESLRTLPKLTMELFLRIPPILCVFSK
jgi:hypothetical protein